MTRSTQLELPGVHGGQAGSLLFYILCALLRGSVLLIYCYNYLLLINIHCSSALLFYILCALLRGVCGRLCVRLLLPERAHCCAQMVMPIAQAGWPTDLFWSAPWNLPAYIAGCEARARPPYRRRLRLRLRVLSACAHAATIWSHAKTGLGTRVLWRRRAAGGRCFGIRVPLTPPPPGTRALGVEQHRVLEREPGPVVWWRRAH